MAELGLQKETAFAKDTSSVKSTRHSIKMPFECNGDSSRVISKISKVLNYTVLQTVDDKEAAEQPRRFLATVDFERQTENEGKRCPA